MTILIIIAWIVGTVAVSFLIGEIIRRNAPATLKTKSNNVLNNIGETDFYDSELSMSNLECIDFINTVSLQRRGSWRIAQNRIMSYDEFVDIRDKEYSKIL